MLKVVFAIALAFSSFQCLVYAADPIVPCYFIFGDSLADNGNNNGLNTKAKANFAPYGVDLPSVGPTGRFTNGRTAVDFITESLGITDFVLPYASTTPADMLRGVNYASAGSGIRPDTGDNQGQHINLAAQVANHEKVFAAIESQKGAQTAGYLESCLYTVGMGSNDYLNNYFLPGSKAGKLSTDAYAESLIAEYKSQLVKIHKLGARKVALFGLGPIGCAPFVISTVSKNNSCVDEVTAAVLPFNAKLKALVDTLNSDFTNAKFIFIDIMEIATTPSASPNAITETKTSCCQTNQYGICNAKSAPCPDRSAYAFFDGFHTTEAVNQGTAARAFQAANPGDAYPTDISHLVQP